MAHLLTYLQHQLKPNSR